MSNIVKDFCRIVSRNDRLDNIQMRDKYVFVDKFSKYV